MDVIFPTFDASWCQNARCWIPRGAQLDLKVRTFSPRCVHLYASEPLYAPPLGGSWNQPFSKVAFGALMGTTLVDLGWILDEFGWIFEYFSMILDTFLQQHLQNANAVWHETK